MNRWILSATVILLASYCTLAATQPATPAQSKTYRSTAASSAGQIDNKTSTAVPTTLGPTAPAATPQPALSDRNKPGEYVIEYEPPYIGLAVKVGTLGPGVEMTIGVTDWLNLRVGGNYFRVRHGGTVQDVDYDVDVKLASVPMLVDIHPFENEFRITGGVLYNRNMADLDATPDTDTKIGDHTYTPEQIGELSGSIRFNNFGPYIGLGYGNVVLDADKTWGFVFDIGIMWQGTPTINLYSDGTMSGDPTFQSDLDQQKNDIQDKADYFRIYPVLSFGISYQF